MSVDRQKITDCVVDLLQRGTTKPVGDHEAPNNPPDFPYCVVYSIPGGDFNGSLGNPDSDALLVYQVDSVGQTRQQADWMADRVRRTMLARAVGGGFQVTTNNPTGWKVNDRRTDSGAGGATPEGQGPNRVFTIPERYVISVTPG